MIIKCNDKRRKDQMYKYADKKVIILKYDTEINFSFYSELFGPLCTYTIIMHFTIHNNTIHNPLCAYIMHFRTLFLPSYVYIFPACTVKRY